MREGDSLLMRIEDISEADGYLPLSTALAVRVYEGLIYTVAPAGVPQSCREAHERVTDAQGLLTVGLREKYAEADAA